MNKNESKSIFQQANQEADKFGTDLPADNYYMRVDGAEITESKAGNQMVVMTYEVMEGAFQGKKHKTFSVLDNKTAVSMLFQTWRKLGYDTAAIDTVEDIQEYCDAIEASNVHLEVTITVKMVKGKEYTNTKINAVVEVESAEAPAAEQAAPSPAPSPADDVPDEPAESSEEEEEEDEEEEDESSEPTVAVGSTVVISASGKKVTGEVTAIDYENEGLTVVSSKTKREYKVPLTAVREIK